MEIGNGVKPSMVKFNAFAKNRPMAKRIGFFVFWSLLTLASCQTEKQPELPPPPVKVMPVVEQSVALKTDLVGQIYGQQDLPIRCRVEGILLSRHFNEGSYVEKGDLLYRIEEDSYEAALAAARSRLAKAKTAFTYAENELKRVRPLAEMNALSQRELEAAIAQRNAAQAEVQAAEAETEAKRIQKSFTNILVPASGIIGKSIARVGEFVGRSPNPVILTTLSTVDSVRVEFFVSESDYLQIARHYGKRLQENEEMNLPLKLVLADGSLYEHGGRVDFLNREVKPSTGSILIQASFPNPEGLLRPGQFARVRVERRNLENALLVPQRAVSEIQGRFSALVLGDSNRVQTAPLEILAPYRDYYVIAKGLEPGQKIIWEGKQKVKEGMRVQALEESFQSRAQ